MAHPFGVARLLVDSPRGRTATMPAESELATRTVPVPKVLTPNGEPIMVAKLRVPVAPPWVVPRPRLSERLSSGVEGPLTVVSAPAGSGKTVLVSSWVSGHRPPGTVVWISLDEQDSHPGVLWSYVLAGLGRAGLPVARVGAPDGPDRSVLSRLAACLAEQPRPVILILDNAQFLTGSAVPDGLDFLLRHAAPQLRVVLVGRIDPALPLHRYRIAGSVTELRCDDLAFTAEEITSLLATHRMVLPGQVVTDIDRQTRGWAAGVRLAALGLQLRGGDHEGYLLDDDGTIADYFVAEVLDAQLPEVRDFLLRTSVVDRLWPGLAAELSGPTHPEPTLTTNAHTSTYPPLITIAPEAY